jgi:general secretion pathway protein G
LKIEEVLEMKSKSRSKGFSLIELIVVVGIIALLAAIAMPNYNNAMVRSKVARFKGDCKACETAIETYAVDYNSYPLSDRFPVQTKVSGWDTWPTFAGGGYLSRRLTTPNAYLAKLPRDIFDNKEDADGRIPTRTVYRYSSDSQNRDIYNSSGKQNYVSWVYAELKDDRTHYDKRPSTAIWMLNSAGPDADRDHGETRNTGTGGNTGSRPVQFDPTNGTNSDGDLFMFGPGLGFGLDE